MSIPPPDWLYDRPKPRGRKRLIALATVVALGGGGWWLAEASPWANEIQTRWEASDAARQVADLEHRVADSKFGQALNTILALGAPGERVARLVPPDTRLYVEFAPSPWTRFWMNFGGKPQGQTAASLDELRAWVRETWKLDWDTDLAPWVDHDMAFTGRGDQQDGEWTLWLASRDAGKADATIQKVLDQREAAGETVTEARHGNARYWVITPPTGKAYALGRVGDFVITAAPAAAITTAIDHVEHGGPSLATDNPRYRRLASAWPKGQLGHAYVDLSAEPGRQQARANNFPPPEAAGASISGGSDWLTIETVASFDVTGATTEARDRWREFIPLIDMGRFDRLPQDSVLAVGATATPELAEWLAAPAALGWWPLGGSFGEGWAFSGLVSGLKNVRGPFAVALVATPPESAAKDPVGAVLALKPTDPQALTDELEKTASQIAGVQDPAHLPKPLSDWAANPWIKNWLPGVTQLAEERHDTGTWKVLRAGGQPLAGWKAQGDDVVLAGGAATLKLCQDDFKSLSRASGFEAVRHKLPDRCGFFVYLDGPNAARLFDASPWLPAKYAKQAQQALKPLRAIGLAGEPGIDRHGFHRAALTVLATP